MDKQQYIKHSNIMPPKTGVHLNLQFSQSLLFPVSTKSHDLRSSSFKASEE